jgi:hypothetical protein
MLLKLLEPMVWEPAAPLNSTVEEPALKVPLFVQSFWT